VRLLPYLEQENLYKQIEIQGVTPPIPGSNPTQWNTSNVAGGSPPRGTVLPIYQCPSDVTFTPGYVDLGPSPFQAGPPLTGIRFGLTSYGANYLALTGETGVPSAPQNVSAVFTDGASQTIIYADKLAKCSVNRTSPIPDSANLWAWNTAAFNVAGTGINYAPYFAVGQKTSVMGVEVYVGTPGPGQVGMCDSINPSNVRFVDKDKVSNCGLASSMHTGGINVCLADGSARAVSPEVDARIWFALLTPSGGTNEINVGDF
jgi:prepilin-type processing-associated H-X9-DG protein